MTFLITHKNNSQVAGVCQEKKEDFSRNSSFDAKQNGRAMGLLLSNKDLTAADRLMEVIEIIKRRKRIKDKDLAEKAGISPSRLSIILKGDEDFYISSFQAILNGLDITFDEFLAHLVRFSDVPDEKIKRVVREEILKSQKPGRD